jgi:pilus assembly protein CpaB
MAAVSTKRRVLLAAVVLGLLTSVMIYRFLDASKAKNSVERATIAVATRRIEARSVISPDMVATREVQANQCPSGACTASMDVVGKVALATIPPDATLMRDSVAEKGPALGLAYAIPNSMRAVSIGVDPVIGVAGFLKPGDHVDVVATYHSGDNAIARTIVQDTKLLALGAQVQTDRISKNDGGPSSSATSKDTATLLVTPSEAERLALADVEGKLRLVLRPAGDLMHVTTTGAVSPSRVSSSVRVEPAPAPARRISRYEGQDYGRVPSIPINYQPIGTAAEPVKNPTPPVKVEPAKPQIQVIRGIEIQTVEVER